MKKTAGSTVRRPSASSQSKSPKASRKRPSAKARGRPTCFVYVIGTRATRGPVTYVGWTTDLEKRLARHNAGTGARATRGHAWRLLYAEGLHDRIEAMSREWYLKREVRLRRLLRALV
jgi:putative endonuclease